MKERSIGFIGGGRVASILLGGWENAGKMPAAVTVCDCDHTALSKLSASCLGVTTTGDIGLAAAQEIVFLAVPPSVVKDVIPEIKPYLKVDTVVVSLAPKLTLAKLIKMFGGYERLMRMIPNAPSIVGKGLNPVCPGPALEAGDRAAIFQILQPLGDCPEVTEEQLEPYALIAAMGPTYFWPQLYQLKALAESFGLSEETAMAALDKMLRGTVATMKNSGLSSDQVQDLIPAKPMAEEVQALCEAYEQKLTGLMQKIKP